MLSACAERADNDAPAVCEWQVDVAFPVYPDGQTRKSDVYLCSDGCTKYAWTNDESVTFTQCN